MQKESSCYEYVRGGNDNTLQFSKAMCNNQVWGNHRDKASLGLQSICYGSLEKKLRRTEVGRKKPGP